MEQASGKDLSWFFEQWLKRPGIPKLTGTWRYDAGRIQVDPFERLDAATRRELDAEADRLAEFHA